MTDSAGELDVHLGLFPAEETVGSGVLLVQCRAGLGRGGVVRVAAALALLMQSVLVFAL